ncbi:MAG: HD domain-containing protein [Gammaproteobacteria bacterium AqS3]|nr:HD domain-containing protein [Gammaproteobacteria bacterium AqS3]
MDVGTKEDWEHISQEHAPVIGDMPKRIRSMLEQLRGLYVGFAVDQLEHSLQTASRAERDGADEEMILLSLCHDIGKVVSVPNHAAIGAEILKPYVSERAYKILLTHQDFQGKYYYHYFDMPNNLRDGYVDEPWYEDACRFSDRYDQAGFDPEYESFPLEHFSPLIDKFFAKPGAMLVTSED